MSEEKPVEVRKGTGKHRIDTRIFARKIHESYCMQKGCRYRGKPAVQGHCHTTTTTAGTDLSDIDALEEYVAEWMASVKKMIEKLPPKKRMQRYWGELFCALMNMTFASDECIALRRKNVLLRDKLARSERAKRGTVTRSKR